MAYTPYTWQDNKVGNTPITAARLNVMENGIADATTAAATALAAANSVKTQTPSDRNAITGWFHVDNFGARGDGTTHDELAIQAAINTAATAYGQTGVKQVVFFSPKTYACGPQVSPDDSQQIYGIMLKSGVELYGQARILVAPGSYYTGTQYSLLRSLQAGLVNAGVRGLTFDGNRASYASVPGDISQSNNITFRTVTNVWITDVTSIECAGTAIMIYGTDFTHIGTEIRITGCRVSGTGNIGIQVSQFNNLVIDNCLVSYTTNNAIDIYGDNNTNVTNGLNFRITNNLIHDMTGTGIFLETVSAGLVSGNQINYGQSDGIHVNRIHGMPDRINIVSNSIIGCTVGITGTGDCQSVTIRGNNLENFNTAGILFGGPGNPGDAGRISGFNVIENTMNGNSDNTGRIVFGSGLGQIVNMLIVRNITKSKNRSFDIVNAGPAPITSTFGAFTSPGD